MKQKADTERKIAEAQRDEARAAEEEARLEGQNLGSAGVPSTTGRNSSQSSEASRADELQ